MGESRSVSSVMFWLNLLNALWVLPPNASMPSVFSLTISLNWLRGMLESIISVISLAKFWSSLAPDSASVSNVSAWRSISPSLNLSISALASARPATKPPTMGTEPTSPTNFWVAKSTTGLRSENLPVLSNTPATSPAAPEIADPSVLKPVSSNLNPGLILAMLVPITLRFLLTPWDDLCAWPNNPPLAPPPLPPNNFSMRFWVSSEAHIISSGISTFWPPISIVAIIYPHKYSLHIIYRTQKHVRRT